MQDDDDYLLSQDLFKEPVAPGSPIPVDELPVRYPEPFETEPGSNGGETYLDDEEEDDDYSI